MTDDHREPPFDSLLADAAQGQGRPLTDVVTRAVAGSEFRCARCHHQPTGFRDRIAAAHFHVLGLCQKCQDELALTLKNAHA